MLRRRLLLVTLLLSEAAWGHDLWLENDGAAVVLHQGHRHSVHAGAESMGYDPARVRDIRCVDGEGRARKLSTPTTFPVRLTASCAVWQLDFVSGFWTKTAWETLNAPKTGISGVLKSWHAEESLKRVDRWTPALARPVGKGLELTPQVDPQTLAVGDKLRLLVSDDGKPLANVPVAYGDETRGASGPDGMIAIRLRRPGIQLISATHEAPRDDGLADRSLRTAILQFEVRP